MEGLTGVAHESMKEMDDIVYSEVLKFCNAGEKYVDQEKYQDAIVQFQEAFKLLPQPKSDWEAGSWIQAAIGDCYFIMENYIDSLKYFRHSEIYPGGIDSGFIQLRIGQSYFELGNEKEAKEYLLRSYLLKGEEIFLEEDVKYRKLIDTIIR